MTKVADRFDILELLANPTDHAIVAKALDRQTKQIVAVKMARPGATIQKRFQREVEAMTSAAGPAVMPVIESDVDGEWYTMPIAEGELTPAVAKLGIADREELAIEVVRAVAEALRQFHQKGMVHRDLKPQNVLRLKVDDLDRWVVSDFGIARNEPGTTTSQQTRAGEFLGSKGWAAPELHHDAHDATPKADIYSLGAIVAWILTEKFPTPTVVPRPEGRFRAIVVRATHLNENQRFGTVDIMLGKMEEALAGQGGTLSQQLDELLVSPIDYADLSDFMVAHSDNGGLLLAELPKLKPTDILMWLLADADGLLSVATSVSGLLQTSEGRAGFNQKELEPPLYWVLDVLKLFVDRHKVDVVDHLAAACFQALDACDQWPPGRAIADWLKGLDDRNATVMIAAAEVTNTADYIRGQIKNRGGFIQSGALRRWIT